MIALGEADEDVVHPEAIGIHDASRLLAEVVLDAIVAVRPAPRASQTNSSASLVSASLVNASFSAPARPRQHLRASLASASFPAPASARQLHSASIARAR